MGVPKGKNSNPHAAAITKTRSCAFLVLAPVFPLWAAPRHKQAKKTSHFQG